MQFRARPLRPTGEPSPSGEAAFDRLPGNENGSKSGMRMPGADGEISGSGGSPPQPMAAQAPGGAAGRGEDHEQGGSSPAESPNISPEIAPKPQPSADDRVPEDMATMVLDNTTLGAGSAPRQGLDAERVISDSLPLDPRLDARAAAHLAAANDPASDAAIMLRVAAGEESGFNYLVEKYHRPMVHFLFRMVRSQAVAEELAQEVFLRVYRSRESYRAEAKFTTWLYRIATNLAVNHARDTKHERAAQNVYLDVADEETGTTPEVADAKPTVEQRMLRDERMAAIRKHVMALPERQRMAVLMHKYQGLDYRQIGEVLKLSESATKSLLFRAYQTLRDKLKDFV
jgi:RNA polymerase sigma-70 factor (ECF subfamily)